MKKNSRNFLSRQEVHKLIDLWAEYIDQLRGKYRNNDVYKKMSLELRARHRLILRSEEIRSRINNLKKQFKIEKQNELSRRGASTWPYFQKLQQILEGASSNNTFEESYAHGEDTDTDNTKFSNEPSSSIPEPLVELKEKEEVTNRSIETLPKRKCYEEEFLRIAKEEQINMEKYFKHSLENDEKIINLLQRNNDLLSQLLNKSQKLDT